MQPDSVGSPGGRRRVGRPPGGQGRLTRERIVREALRLVDRDGLDGLSMRRLANELGVDPMSIYHHIPNKAAIVSALVHAVFAEMEPPAASGPWQQRVRAWAQGYRQLARSHPNLVLQIVADAAAASEAAHLISEPLHDALGDAGLSAHDVVQAAATIVDFVNGFVLAEAAHDQAASFDAGFDASIEIILRGIGATAEAQ